MREYLGEFEQVVLLALARLEGGGYGAEIHAEILKASGRDVSIPSVYVTLKRLEKKSCVTSTVRPDPSGGRAKRIYTLQEEGQRALHRSRDMLNSLWKGVELRAGRVS